ncbi:ImmA/IrrE family metallo-endopeptidase [Agromyces hippuratus]
MLEAFERQFGSIESLRADPIEWLHSSPEFELRILEPNAPKPIGAPDCAVDGCYLGGPIPPRIGVGESVRARMNFTALHELGHHVQRTTDQLADALGERDDIGLALEERACDMFAAQILVPEEVAHDELGEATPSATAVVALMARVPQASRAVVVIRAAKNLASDGHVALLDEYGLVGASSSRGAFGLRTGSDQTATEVWTAVRARPGQVVHTRSRFAYGGILAGETMYTQAAPVPGTHLTVIVAATERVPWEFSVYAPHFDSYGYFWTCERPGCGHEFRVTKPACATCGKPECERCGKCGCGGSLAEFTCSKCTFVRSPAEASETPGVCNECV